MHTPTKAQMQVVIDNLKKVTTSGTRIDALDMGQSAVNKYRHKCGTTHCFAGWYAVATLDTSKPLSFEDGKTQIDLHLGFTNQFLCDTFDHWADQTPQLWGNINGMYVFNHKRAFFHPIKRINGAENLQHIVDHLEEVRDRLPL